MIRFIPTLPLRPTYLRRLLASQVPARSRSKHTVSGIARPAPPASFSTQDDGDLRQLFDRPTNTNSPSARPTGLFDYPLGPALSLRPLTERTLIHAQAIVDRICNSPGDPTESRRVVKNLDRLSDLLCGVIDMCELVRSVHPDQQWVDECDLVYERLSSFMNELNTHTGMYEALLASIETPHSIPFTAAETTVAELYLRDFEKSGIHLPPSTRNRFVKVSDTIISVGRTFLNNSAILGNPETEIEFPDPHRLLAGLGTQMVNNMEWGSTARGQDPTSVYVKPGTMQAACINQWAQNAKAREILYKGVNAPDPRKVAVLEEMLRARGELATVLGKETYAHVALADKMAKTPRNVDKFLTSLVKHQRPAAEADLLKLRLHKAQMVVGKYYRDTNEHTGPLPEIHAWDRDYFTLFRQSKMEATNSLSPYLSVGTVINGLSQLFDRLYGISFRPASVAPGEVWDPSIRRVNVVHETEGQIGVIYFDLWTRAGKSSAAAHFTVRCSRRVDDDDVAGDGLEPGWDATFGPGLETEGSAIKGKEGRYQLPIVVLTTDFGVERQKTPKLLTWHDVDVLFHEMGHAIHSMIGRTEFHNVSGTRCATDFVELPSILMEHFAASPDVLCSFAKHHETNKPIPRELVNAHVAQHQDMGALDTHNQILMALLDQKYHNLTVDQLRDPSFNSTKMLYDLNSQYSVIKPVENTGWQTSFGHLHGYGATYYSYLLDRAIAGKVWSTLFTSEEEGSLSRKGGEVFKEKVLKWGGGKDPWEMVGDVVGGQEGEVVARGDEKSMDVVGSWLTKG